MWNSVNKIPHREKSKALPDHTSLDTLCSSFSKFFTDKITLIRSNFVTNDHSHDLPEPPHVENTMDQFTPTTTSEVWSIILKFTNASCDLDQIPTRLLKHYIDYLIDPITAIINRLRGRVVKGVGHLDHDWSYGVREVVSSIPDRGNIVGWVFHPTRWLVRFSHLNMPFLQNSEFI